MLSQLQDRLIVRFGNTVPGRAELVGQMLHTNSSETTAYWFQLLVSIGIATLGLVVGSSATVIGAMLVAPLMGPIIGLAMGLATGSPFLVLRSSSRIVVSVLVVIAGASAITLMLPFHELNQEISARTAPTLLDLITAAFCALAGVYATLRPSSETTTTAAGTSISISLVPPLCASGYGVGISSWNVAGGAALLFLTNLVAIVVVGSICFVAVGFNQVDTSRLEKTSVGDDQGRGSLSSVLSNSLSRVFDSRFGPALRFLMPFVLVATVYVPLRRALDEVAWQVRARAAVQDAVAKEAPRVVQSRVRVERHEIDIALVVLGTNQDAENAQARLIAAVQPSTGVPPHIEIYAVPDATAFAGLESSLLSPRLKPAAAPTVSPNEQLAASTARIRAAVQSLWPEQSAGEALEIQISNTEPSPLHIRVVHLGRPLSAEALETLNAALTSRLETNISVDDAWISSDVLDRSQGDLRLMTLVTEGLAHGSSVSAMRICVRKPAQPLPGRHLSAQDTELKRALDAVLTQSSRVIANGEGPWRILFTTAACPSDDRDSSAASKGAR